MRRLVSSSSAAIGHAPAAEFLRDQSARGEVLLLAPTRAAADEFTRAVSATGLAGVHRLTLAQLAAAIASPLLAERNLAPMSRLAMEALAARVTHQLRRSRRLAYFAPVADTPGFARALATTVTELRLQEVDSRALAATGPPGGDLAQLLALYAEHLSERSLADFPLILTLAAGSAAHRFSGLPLVLLDVPVRTKLEQRFVAGIAAQSPAVCATVPEGDLESLNALEAALGVHVEALEQTPASAHGPARTERSKESADSNRAGAGLCAESVERTLERVRRFLFFADLPVSAGPDGSIEIFSAAGEGLECVEIARRLHALAATGLAFDRVAILLRAPERYLPLLEEALRRAAIPAYFSHGTVRPDSAGRAFLALLACAAESCSASRFAEYLSLSQVPQLDPGGAPIRIEREWTRTDDEVLSAFQRDPLDAGAPGHDDAPSLRVPVGWEQLLVDAAVIGGADRWKRRLDGLSNELTLQLRELRDEERRALIERRLGQLRSLRQFALPLIDILAGLPQEATWSDWLDRLAALAETALRHPESVLSLLNELRPMAEVGPAALDEVYGVLSDRLRFLRGEPPPRRYGRVWIGSIDEARGRSFDVVFLPGLAEGIFPRRALEDPLLLDVHRAKLGGLSVQDDRVARERLLLRIATAVARERLIVSFPRMDTAQARPRVPSFYALEVLRAAEGRLPDLREFEKRAAKATPSRLGSPAPVEARAAIDDAEYDLATLWSLRASQPRETAGRGRYLVLANAHLGRTLRTRFRRWQPAWSFVDGLVDPNEAARTALETHRLNRRSYSPTALQQFAACPYRFLLYAIHRLQPREEKVAIEKLDPLTRGALFHEAQFDIFAALTRDAILPLSAAKLPHALDLVDTVLNALDAKYAEELAPAIPGVWSTEIEDIRTDLRGWVRHLAEAAPGWIPIHAEFAFGLQWNEKRDPASRTEEAVILDGVRLRGSVDLIEKHATRNVLRVTDHKTGKAPSPAPLHIGGGRMLQPFLYSLAVERLLETQVEMARLFHCTQRGNFTDLHMAVKEIGRHAIRLALETIDLHVADGFLPAAPAPDTCGYCDYHAVCGPYEELRIRKKSPKELEPLNQLRILP